MKTKYLFIAALLLSACSSKPAPVSTPACVSEGMYCQPIRSVWCKKWISYGGEAFEDRDIKSIDIPCPQ